MAFSSGTFSLYSPGNPVVTGTTISSSWANNTLTDIASGLSTCILKDGTQTLTASIPFATFKATGVGDPTAAQDAATKNYVDRLAKNPVTGRLTLTSGTAVTTGDVTAATTLYFTPFHGVTIDVYNGTQWIPVTYAELSVTVPATASTPFDVFVSGSSTADLTMVVTNWTNDTTRATALTTQNGILVKSGTTTQRYIGSGRTTAVSGQTEDSAAKRYLFNYYNRVLRQMQINEGTDTWTYTTATYRQANATSRNQLDLMIGVSEDMVGATVMVVSANTSATASGVAALVAIGLDTTSAPSVGFLNMCSDMGVTNDKTGLMGTWAGYPGVGRHYLAWLEQSAAAGTTTWYGDNAGAIRLSGMTGVCWA